MTHSYVWRDSFIRVAWLIRTCDMTHSYVWHDSFKCVTWIIHMCDVTHSYVWHDLFMCVTRLIRMCDMTQVIRVTWLSHMCDMTHKMCDMVHGYRPNTLPTQDTTDPRHYRPNTLDESRHAYAWRIATAWVRITFLRQNIQLFWQHIGLFCQCVRYVYVPNMVCSAMCVGPQHSMVSFAKAPCKSRARLQKRP